MTQEELEIKFEEVFDKNTKATGGGYEADWTSMHGLWTGLLPIIIQFAKEYAETICHECNGEGSVEGKTGGNEGIPEADVLFVCQYCNGTGKIKQQ